MGANRHFDTDTRVFLCSHDFTLFAQPPGFPVPGCLFLAPGGRGRGRGFGPVVQNAELFTLTYGAMVMQLIQDFEDVGAVNKQLESM